jgi:hypothetical protein
LYRIKKFSSDINRSITQSLQRLMLRNQAAVMPERSVFDARKFWYNPQSPAAKVLHALPFLNALPYVPAQPAAPAMQAMPPA